MTFIKILYNYHYMFEKLITDLKKSLPEPLRKKMGGEEKVTPYSQEEDNGDMGFNELAPKGKKKLSAAAMPGMTANASSASVDEAAKKRNGMIVRVIIILGIAYFVVDEFILKQAATEKTADELVAAATKKRKKKSIIKPPAESETAAAGTPADPTVGAPELAPGEIALTASSADASSDSSPTTTVTTDTPPIENINVMSPDSLTEKKAVAAEPAVEAEPAVTQTRVADLPIDKKIDQLVESVDQSNTVEEIKIPSQAKAPAIEEKSPALLAMEEAKKQQGGADNAASMSSKIPEEIPEVPAPAYDQVGRGLVYNCKDKYWACLDKPAFLNCNKNMKWNKSKGNPAECVVQDIYNTDEDCAKIQKYNVSTNVATGFCSN
jgi:hypothetical protein